MNVHRHIAFAVLLAFASSPFAGSAIAQSAIAAAVAKPVSLPDIAIGPEKAPVTITEYSSLTCPHCAAFGQNVFPMLRSKYIDAGKVRFVFREFPLDIKAAAATILARCIGKGDSEKYLGAVEILFKLQDRLMAQTKDTLFYVGRLHGMSVEEVEACEKDQTQFDKLNADQQYAARELKVTSTPTFFLNGVRFQGSMSFEELEERLKPLLKEVTTAARRALPLARRRSLADDDANKNISGRAPWPPYCAYCLQRRGCCPALRRHPRKAIPASRYAWSSDFPRAGRPTPLRASWRKSYPIISAINSTSRTSAALAATPQPARSRA